MGKTKEKNQETILSGGIQRRDFLKGATLAAVGMTPMAALFGCSAQAAEEGGSSTPSEGSTAPTVPVSASGDKYTLEELNELRQTLIDSKGEYVCEDGTVIPEVYTKLRALIDTYGNGVGSDVTDASFVEVMYHFNEEDAQAYLEMPLGVYFTATDFSVKSGRSEEECLEICEDLGARGLLMRVRRAGVPYFHHLAEAHGIWEYCLLYDRTPEYVEKHAMQWGTDIRQNLYNAETSFYYAIPINKEVVADEEILPYDDYEKIIARNSVIAVSDCQCRLSHELVGIEDPGNHPLETCMTTGEQAEFYIENGIGRQIDQEEALAILKRSVDAGMVLQSCNTKDTEVICSCHGDCCDILMSYVALGDEYGKMNGSLSVSHYNLAYDKDACIKCGACELQCPLFAITADEEGYRNAGVTCIRCGQCSTVCPANARMLSQKDEEELLDLPDNLLEDYNMKAEYRFRHDMIR